MSQGSTPRHDDVIEGTWRLSTGCDGTRYLHLFSGSERVTFCIEAEPDDDGEDFGAYIAGAGALRHLDVSRETGIAIMVALGDKPR